MTLSSHCNTAGAAVQTYWILNELGYRCPVRQDTFTLWIGCSLTGQLHFKLWLSTRQNSSSYADGTAIYTQNLVGCTKKNNKYLTICRWDGLAERHFRTWYSWVVVKGHSVALTKVQILLQCFYLVPTFNYINFVTFHYINFVERTCFTNFLFIIYLWKWLCICYAINTFLYNL